MYNLEQQFNISNQNKMVDKRNVITGHNFRISVLSNILIRLEYSEEGTFIDDQTEKVLNRGFESVDYKVNEIQDDLIIETKKFKLTYKKGKPFIGTKFDSMANLKIELLGTDKIWFYKHPEARTYPAPLKNLFENKNSDLTKGLYSLDGFVSIDDSKSNLIKEGNFIPKEKETTDIYVFMYGNDYSDMLKDYFTLTGKPALIPRYALGNWWAKNRDYNDEQISKLISDFKENDIPVSILLLNPDWHKRIYEKKSKIKTGFTFNNELIKNESSLVNNLHRNGVRLGLNVNLDDGIYPYEKNYELVTKYLAPDKNGSVPFNTLDSKHIDIYFKILIHPLDNINIDFYNVDSKTTNKNIWMLTHYHFLDMMRDYKRRPMVLSRNYGIMAHRYPVLYSGKTIVGWDTLKKIPFHNSACTNIGVSFWAHDIGGYTEGIEDNELYTRFVQLGTFSPILKFGSDRGKYYKREPWRWEIKTYSIVKKYLKLRHQLIPYLYTESYNYHQNSVPLIKPIYYNYPPIFDDELYRNEYFFGSEFFIAPILNKKDYVMNRVIHRIFIPEGTWIDFFTGKKFHGNKKYVTFYKDNEYPVFVKEGSIIVLGNNKNINDTTPPTDMEIQVFPGKSNNYTLYEDDGISDLYKKGFFLKTNIDYNYMPNNYTVIVRALEGKKGIVPDNRNYKFRFRNTKKSNDVSVYLKDQQIEFKSYVDKTDFIIEVNNVDSVSQLTINCKGTDIEIDAIRIIKDDVESIISDLPIKTSLKEKLDEVFFSDLPLKKKRINIRKLGSKGLEKKFVKLFLKLLDYIGTM